jgi:hypothetical protein
MSELQIKPNTNTVIKHKILGGKMFDDLYAVIYICSKRKSGKSTLISHIVKHSSNKSTKILIFSPTHNKCAVYADIKARLIKKKIYHECFHHFQQDGEDKLDALISMLQDEEEASAKSNVTLGKKQAVNIKQLMFPTSSRPKPKPKPKPPITPEWLIILDDLGESMRAKSVSRLCQIGRHFKCRIIMSGHNLHHLSPQCLTQIDYAIFFSGVPEEKILKLNEMLDLGYNEQAILMLYHTATEKKYNFLMCDVNKLKFRKNFDKILTINN